MARFKKTKGKGTQAINTSSLPDIIFMLLFFFMVTTVMKETTLFIKIKVPKATEVQKLEKKSLVSYIYIGTPYKTEVFGTEPRIQLNDQFATVDNIQEFVYSEIEKVLECDRPFVTTSLKVDEEVNMGLVSDIKQELREANALKINYSTLKGIRKK